MADTFDGSLGPLRAILLALKAVGPDGFEGLLTVAVAAVTGLEFRLAKAGEQFGRDALASTPSFGIALEAKLYDDKMRLEILAGKVTLARFALNGRIDVWALGTTSGVDERVAGQLRDLLESHGISLVLLDWAPNALPRLATLLASAKRETLSWFVQHRPQDVAVVEEGLDLVAGDPSFLTVAALLARELQAAHVGLDALRQQNSKWLLDKFRDRSESQRAFGQYIALDHPSTRAVPRVGAEAVLAEAVEQVLSDKSSFVAVLGAEGTGKTWLVARWWRSLATSPILVFIAADRAESLERINPLEALASVLADQVKDRAEITVEGWCRRLHRWKERGGEGTLRFVVTFDGLNERADGLWATFIRQFVPEIRALGGAVIITAREHYWRRDVLPRLSTDLTAREVEVRDYTDSELREVLDARGVALSSLSSSVREFIRNPRVCALAVQLLQRLQQPEQLTVERLFLEYWRSRLEERGDLIGHNVHDFHDLLKSHARQYIRAPFQSFERNDWRELSGAARREQSQIKNDLTEIEEGRFLTVVDGDPQRYQFRPEALPFAIALLIVDELKTGLKQPGANATELLERGIEAVRGFDILSEVLAAAAWLAIEDSTCPPAGRAALIAAGLSVQNIHSRAEEILLLCLTAATDLLLDTLESEPATEPATRIYSSLKSILASQRDSTLAHSALQRVPDWLGRWSRAAQAILPAAEHEKHETARKTRIETALSQLSGEERRLFDRLCRETSAPLDDPLDSLAALVLARRPLAQFAEGLVAWALVQAIARDMHNAEDALCWIVRLNTIDPTQTREAVTAYVAQVSTESSTPMKRAAAIALRLLGAGEEARRASILAPLQTMKGWKRAERFCDVNPHDPGAGPCTNLEQARRVAQDAPTSAIWMHASSTSQDHDLQLAVPALARFDSPVIIESFRQIVTGVTARAGRPLLHLTWELPWLSPLFDGDSVRVVRGGLERVLGNPDLVSDRDLSVVIMLVVLALLPHYHAHEQLELLASLPENSPQYDEYTKRFKPLTPDEFQHLLADTVEQGRLHDLRRLVFFASANAVELTTLSRKHLEELWTHSDADVAIGVAQIAFHARDQELDRAILSKGLQAEDLAPGDSARFLRRRAFAHALIEQKRVDLLDQLDPFFLDYAAEELGKPALDLLASRVEQALTRLLQPIAAVPPNHTRLVVGVSADGMELSRSVEPMEEDRDIVDVFRELAEPEKALRRDQERYDQLRARAFEFDRELAREGASALSHPVVGRAFGALVADRPDKVSEWLDAILNAKDPGTLRQVSNLGLAMAGAYAAHDASKAARVLNVLQEHPSYFEVEVGRVPLYVHAAFAVPDAQGLDWVRSRLFCAALTDAELEGVIQAAEHSNAHEWLDRQVNESAASQSVGEQARALTACGFRSHNAASETMLADADHDGFLGRVHAYALKSYQRHQWCCHWLDLAARSSSGADFWRFAVLACGVADRRALDYWTRIAHTCVADDHEAEFLRRLRQAAESRSRKRAGTLFGNKAPGAALTKALRERGEDSTLER